MGGNKKKTGGRNASGKNPSAVDTLSDQSADQSTQKTDSRSKPEPETEDYTLAIVMKKLDAIGTDVRDILTNMFEIQSDIADLKASISHAGDTAQEALDKVNVHEHKFDAIDDQLAELKNDHAQIVRENKQLKEHVLRNECQNRRNNLVFDGIPEARDESDEDCLESVYKVLGKPEVALKAPNNGYLKIFHQKL
jgi:septal ring factor EnvC (AmiA/AmiB activator)